MRSASLTLVCAALLAAPGAGWAETAPAKTPDQMTAEDIMKTLLARGEATGKIDVEPARAALCPVCHQPLYKHSEPGFVCRPDPIDPVTGKPRRPQEIRYVPVVCPVCQAKFDGPLTGNINDHGGVDRDFCRHSVGRLTVHSSVWMCPDCGYAGMASQAAFGKEPDGKPLSEQSIRFVREQLSPATRKRMEDLAGLVARPDRPIPPSYLQFSSYVDQTTIPDWIKYDNALRLVESRDAKLPHTLLARLYLEAAHACRRQVCAEVAVPLLDSSLQIPLSGAIRRVAGWLNKNCLEIRQGQKAELLDPTQAETDPEVLNQAAGKLQASFDAFSRNPPPPDAAGQQPTVTVLDQLVLYLRHASFLDRLGRLGEARAKLEKARDMIPASPREKAEPLERDAREYVQRQLELFRSAAVVRLECLDRERQLLYKAADQLMQALYFNENPERLAPATNAYLVGELLRRDGREPEAAAAWFQATRQLLPLLDPDKVQATIPPGASREEADALREKARQELLAQREVLAAWTEEQSKLVRVEQGTAARENVQQAIARVLARAQAAPPAAGPAQPDRSPPPPQPAPEVRPVVPPPGLTREVLLIRYHQALARHQQDKQALPVELSELVKEKYLKPEEACLDAQGRLSCPVTGKRLIYMSTTAWGEPTQPLIFPLRDDPNQVRLFADGRIGEK